ncbi:MAG TPA: class I SAM-dependent methyltransferase [Desulfobacterales bacterium]
MGDFDEPESNEIEKINRRQRELFDDIVHVFEPPLPEGVPERLEAIVAAGAIAPGECVLDVGSGTGILIPLIQAYRPGCIYACDLSGKMLEQLNRNYSGVKTVQADVRELSLPDASVDAAFLNACYPNIADKNGALANIARMMRTDGRMVISHPLGKAFIESLRKRSPFPLDDFPTEPEAKRQLAHFGFVVRRFVDDPELYLLVAVKMGAEPS